MKATKLTMIALFAGAIIIGGCSNDNRIAGPGNNAIPDIDKDRVESNTPAETENSVTRITAQGDEQNVTGLSITAEVFRTDVEGGCWYLTSESGDNYTPITPKSLSLKLGMVLRAKGYIDWNILFFCGNGPAFVIEQYEILNASKWPSKDSESEDTEMDRMPYTPAEERASALVGKFDMKKQIEEQASQAPTEDRAIQNSAGQAEVQPTDIQASQLKEFDFNKKKLTENQVLDISSEVGGQRAPAEDRAPRGYTYTEEIQKPRLKIGRPVPIIYDKKKPGTNDEIDTLEGYVKKAKEGCLLLETGNKEVFELHHDTDVLLETGTRVQVTGYISMLLNIGCSGAPVFYADNIRILSYPKEPLHPASEIYSVSEDAEAQKVIQLEGTMHSTEPEGMCWYFETDNQKKFELLFSDTINLRSGMRLKIVGVAALVSTFCESGKPLRVLRWETVNENKF